MGYIDSIRKSAQQAAKANEYDRIVDGNKAKAIYDKGASDSENALAAYLYKNVMQPQGQLGAINPNAGLAQTIGQDISPLTSDAPAGVENISYEQAVKMGLVQ